MTVGRGLTFYSDRQRHLVCVPYTVENLHRMARELGIHRSWFHAHPRHPHYDVPKRRISEIAARTQVVSPRMILAITRGVLPIDEGAVAPASIGE